jgi:hypothetical protein
MADVLAELINNGTNKLLMLNPKQQQRLETQCRHHARVVAAILFVRTPIYDKFTRWLNCVFKDGVLDMLKKKFYK